MEVPAITSLLLPLLGGLVACLITAPFGPLLARYRGIFFSMLTLAMSMVGYGVLVKTDSLGGSDGFNMGRVTLLGQALAVGIGQQHRQDDGG